VKMGLW